MHHGSSRHSAVAFAMAALLPRLRARLSDDRVFALGSVTVGAALVVYAAAPYLTAALAGSFIAGLGWLCCLSTLSVASQDALPSWVRARGLAFCLTALSAGVALGAVFWGVLASADGVMVAGCEIGSCHFIEGNKRARKRVGYAKHLVQEAGLNPERLEMFHIAASQGPLFAQTAREFTEHIKQINAAERAQAGVAVTGEVS